MILRGRRRVSQLQMLLIRMSSHDIKISVVSQFRILVPVQLMNTRLLGIFPAHCLHHLDCSAFLSDIVTQAVDADWRRLNLLTGSRCTSPETQTQIRKWLSQGQNRTLVVHCLRHAAAAIVPLIWSCSELTKEKVAMLLFQQATRMVDQQGHHSLHSTTAVLLFQIHTRCWNSAIRWWFIWNIQDTNDAIDFFLKKSVQYHARVSWNPCLPVGKCDGWRHSWKLKSPERKFSSKPLLTSIMLAISLTFSKFIAKAHNSWRMTAQSRFLSEVLWCLELTQLELLQSA